MKRYTSDTLEAHGQDILDQISKANLQPGSPLELVLFEGAKHDKGSYSSRQGYVPDTHMSAHPDLKLVGYYIETSKSGDVSCSSGWQNRRPSEAVGKSWYADARCVHSIRVLK